MNNYDNQLLTQKKEEKSDPHYKIQEHDYLNIIQTEFFPIHCNNEAKKVQDATCDSSMAKKFNTCINIYTVVVKKKFPYRY